MNELNAKILEYKEEIIKSIAKMVSIPSIEDMPIDGAPFGKYPKLALDEILEIAKKLGFETKNINNAIGYAQYGESEDYIAILGHIDVVEAGEGWDSNPFEMIIKDEKLIGRGVLDNKGPTVVALYVLKAIKDLNIELSKSIRIIFGTNEETGFKDIKYYLDCEKPPLYGFTPDCKYPVIYGEKGMLDVVLSKKILGGIDELEFENEKRVSNVVPDNLKVILSNKLKRNIKIDNIKIDKCGNKIIFKGKSCHSKSPSDGINAITFASLYLKELEFENKCLKSFFKLIYSKFYDKYNGEGCYLNIEDESGKLVTNLYDIFIKENEICIKLSIRYPVSFSIDDIKNKLEEFCAFNRLEMKIKKSIPALNVDKNSFLIKTLEAVFEEETCLNGKATFTNGGTYAKIFPNIVAFGPSLGGMDGNAHSSNEFIEIEELMINAKIFANAIISLAK